MPEPGILLGTAFVLGYLAKLVHLPPLVGFLAAGFVLRAFLGYEMNDQIGTIADLGVTLMLFTIGLKLKIKDLLRPPVWVAHHAPPEYRHRLYATAATWRGSWSTLSQPARPYQCRHRRLCLSVLEHGFAVVMFQQAGSNGASHAKLAIGVLIMQDIFAVAYLTISKGVMPTWLAIPLLIGLWPLRLILLRLFLAPATANCS